MRFANRPAQRNDSIEDGASERSTEVASSFAPIETGPAQRTPAAFERVDIDAGLGEKPFSARRHPHRIAAAGEQPPLHEPVEHSHREAACKMIIAGPRLAQFGLARAGADAGEARAGTPRNQPFEAARDLGIGEAERALPPPASDRGRPRIVKAARPPRGG